MLRGLAIGALVGSLMGSWSASSQRAAPAVLETRGRPRELTTCPDGYVRVAGYDPSAEVAGTRARWLIRCDPREGSAPVSESLEVFWLPQVQFDPRARAEALADFMRSVARTDRLLLEPLGEPARVTLGMTSALAIDVDGALRLPAFVQHVWLLPAGGSTLVVLASAPRDHAERVVAAARTSLSRVEGLLPWTDTARSERGWHVEVACPAGYTDATPHGGGAGDTHYLGRYCFAPREEGSAELSYIEFPAPASNPRSVEQTLTVLASMTRAIGVGTGQGYGPVTMERVRGFDVPTASLSIETPSARLHLRGYVAPAGDALVYSLATSMFDHAPVARETLERWLPRQDVVRALDPGLLRAWQLRRTVGTVVVPAVFTAALGALVGALWKRVVA